jgi:AcrR family transcriptional regulator
MTEKQKLIFDAALRLFARDGYNSTSTNKIAKEAGVSEGLIFRHFKNKEGLLDFIVQEGLEIMAVELDKITFLKDAREKLKAALLLPSNIIDAKPDYWKVQVSLKYMNHEIAEKYHQSEFMENALALLLAAFTGLGYKNPVLEAQLMMMIISSLFLALVHGDIDNHDELIEFLVRKYKL